VRRSCQRSAFSSQQPAKRPNADEPKADSVLKKLSADKLNAESSVS
jgi:hypothetical protein